MRIADVLRSKGTLVATVAPESSVTELLAQLTEHNVGAMVVLGADEQVVGIVSERDVVRRLHDRGPELLNRPVSEIMTTLVATCTPEDSVDHLSAVMTERRIRHVPVVVDGRLAGIVSIGDVVKTRLNELEERHDQLQAYIAQG
ncbi:CBS domain-containing protein [Amycolatopsis albispora]|uniref:Histidine kinase n=1 Tax=Amycolatopsis albispora TaxID=1804986 RepID=A0A344L7E3_9PSEU|nr:CBS domain-containing protein [Amycolatopsis albispora]AXB43967.1 histidine kinase [Amycolatopsis albispora]